MTSSLHILDRLIGFKTISSASNLDIIDFIENFLSSRGFRLTRLTDPGGDKAGLYAELGPSEPGGVLLSAHSDVVPVKGQDWTRPPFRLTREGDWLFGRGTTDMKGFLAEMLSAADRAKDLPLRAPLKLLISYDEEIGCVGLNLMRDRLTSLIARPQIAIVGEPTEMQVAIGHKGKRAYRTEVAGQAGHSSLAPNYVSALQVGAEFVSALASLKDDLRHAGPRDLDFQIPYTTIHVGTFRAGTALNIVPDSAVITFEVRHLANDDPDALEASIHKAAQSVAPTQLGPDALRIDVEATYPGLAIDATHAAVKEAQRWAGGDTCKVGFGTEAGILADMGIPSIVCGPGSMERHGHKADECIDLGQLEACSRMLDAALASLC
ncbi:MAG: acetylornithine deacetylase [Pseudomonadota bacterium]